MELNDDTREFAELILQYINDPDGRYSFQVIKDNPELEHVTVVFEITKLKDENHRLTVIFHSNRIFSHHSSYYELKVYERPATIWKYTTQIRTAEELEKAIKTASDNLDNIFYDKFYDKFVDRTDEVEMKKYRLERLKLKVFKHKRQNKETICSVCHEETRNQTVCGHHLCGLCWENLVKPTCPICRQCCDYCDEEDEEEYE